MPADPARARKRVITAAAVLVALAATPQALAADYARTPDTVTVYRPPVVPTDGGAAVSPHHETTETPLPDDDTSRTVKTAAIGTVVTIIVAAGVCLATSGVLCMFPMMGF